jgi:hypothetical protein
MGGPGGGGGMQGGPGGGMPPGEGSQQQASYNYDKQQLKSFQQKLNPKAKWYGFGIFCLYLPAL